MPQFVTPSAALPVGLQLLVLGVIHTVNCAIVYSAVGIGAGRLGEILKRRLGLARVIRWLAGSVLIALGLRLVFPGKRWTALRVGGMDPPRGHDAGERVRASFARQGLMRLLGAEVVEVGEAYCVVEVPFAEEITQQESYFHGAVTAAIADTAGGYAAMTLAPPEREVLTVEYKVNFLGPAHGEKLVARGEVVTAGRRLFVCRAEVFAVEGRDERVCAATLQTVSLSPARAPDRKPGA